MNSCVFISLRFAPPRLFWVAPAGRGAGPQVATPDQRSSRQPMQASRRLYLDSCSASTARPKSPLSPPASVVGRRATFGRMPTRTSECGSLTSARRHETMRSNEEARAHTRALLLVGPPHVAHRNSPIVERRATGTFPPAVHMCQPSRSLHRQPHPYVVCQGENTLPGATESPYRDGALRHSRQGSRYVCGVLAAA